MKISVIGTGYVGLVVGACLAEMGNAVVCVDNNLEKIAELKKGIIPIFEPGLEELIIANGAEGRLNFTNDLKSVVAKSQVCFIAVGTPQCEDGSCNLSAVYGVAKEIGQAMSGYTVVVDKSTVPVGTAEQVTDIIKSVTNEEFDVVSNPEFLKQGDAVNDFLKPDRVVIGSNSHKATEVMQELYAPYLRTGNPVIVMDVKSAEMTKYAANSFLATKISFINEISNICEKIGADVEMVRIGMTSDKRIGSQFLYPGLGYGGSCFPKDVKALIKVAQDNDANCDILSAADSTNQKQRLLFLDKIMNYFDNDFAGKTIAVWGLAFKPRTNDMREAPAITIINKLLEKGAKIKAFDPKAFDSAKVIFKDKIEYCQTRDAALEQADALLLLTEWNEFKRPDFDRMKKLLKTPVVFDGRNQYEEKRMKERGFEYICIGKKPVLKSKQNV